MALQRTLGGAGTSAPATGTAPVSTSRTLSDLVALNPSTSSTMANTLGLPQINMDAAGLDLARRMGLSPAALGAVAMTSPDGQRIGTAGPAPGVDAAYGNANTLGFGGAMPSQPVQQAPSSVPGNTGVANTARPSAAATVAAQGSNINTAAANPDGTRPMQSIPTPGSQATNQLSPQAQAMIAEIMRQRARSTTQAAVENHGVFAGQQQGVQMPTMAMPAVPVRR